MSKQIKIQANGHHSGNRINLLEANSMSTLSLRELARRISTKALRCLSIALALQLCALSALAQEVLDRVITCDIPAHTEVENALIEWGTRAGVTVMINTKFVENRVTSKVVKGQLTARAALALILEGSGLTYTANQDRVSILPVGVSPYSSDNRSPLPSDSFPVADLEPLVTPSSQSDGVTSSPDSSETTSTGGLAQVVVTAQKREQRTQDVPMALSVIDTESLVESNQTKLTDYYASVPGISVTPMYQNGMNVAIRGIASNASAGGGASATTGILVDDVPFGAGVLFVPDFDPGDLQRIEVLRGPQGTLYGSSSMGGLLKFVTADPSPQGFTGRVEVGADNVYNGGGIGYTVRGLINAPLGENLAVRASAFTREDPGYLDNPVLGLNGINIDHSSGGHLAILWRPEENLSLKVSGLYQKVTAESTNDITTYDVITLQPLGDLQQGYTYGGQANETDVQAYDAVLKWKLGGFEFASISGYNSEVQHVANDLSLAIGAYSQMFFQVGGWKYVQDGGSKTFSQEFRLSATFNKYLDGLLGIYYNYDKNSPDLAFAYATIPTTGATAAQWVEFVLPGFQDESAAFVNFTVHPADHWDIQVGGRETRLRQFSNVATFTGPYDPDLLQEPSPVTVAQPPSEEHAFTYLFSPEYRFSSDVMAYARIASGFRAGGYNGPNIAPFGGTNTYNPDKTTNYEVGLKGDFLDHVISIDTSVYYIDWQQIQVELETPRGGQSYTGNAGRAKSEGVDFSIQARPFPGLQTAAWVSYDDAELTDVPAAQLAAVSLGGFYAQPGDRLPYAAKVSGNISVDDEIPVTHELRVYGGATLSYIGDRLGLFTGTADRTYLPGYTKIDLKGGVNFGLWKFNLYANNVTDRRGLISGGLGNVNPESFFIVPPRLVGLSVSRLFE